MSHQKYTPRYTTELFSKLLTAAATLLMVLPMLANEDRPPIVHSSALPTAYEERQPTGYPLLFVIHETAEPFENTRRSVRSPNYEASFHALIHRNGTIYLYVPPHMKAWTGGFSRFNPEIAAKARQNPDFKPWSVPYDPHRDEAALQRSRRPSVNDFAFQVELVSPPDGYWCRQDMAHTGVCVDNPIGRRNTHSGYTPEQYRSLAWLAAVTRVKPERITTHKEIELTADDPHTDPRGFNWPRFWQAYKRWKG